MASISSIRAAAPASTSCRSSASSSFAGKKLVARQAAPIKASKRSSVAVTASQDPLLLRAAKGEDVERTPVWLMRQAGRYMAAFREYSDKYPFRQRSETPEIAIALSLQPYEAYKTDGVIMFSDILTPLPGVGIEFDVIRGKGPRIETPIRSMEQVKELVPLDDPEAKLPFIQPILSTLRQEIDDETTLLGFIGTPWTLAAYSMEGKADRHLVNTKQIMTQNPEILHGLLSHLTEALITYCVYQIDSGAQVIQLFDSWAHHLSPSQFLEFSLPYAEKVMAGVRAQRPGVPLIFHANGGTGKLQQMTQCTGDVIGLDWSTTMEEARATFGPNKTLQGNMDPMLLFAPDEVIESEVKKILEEANGRHILNVGHGVVQGTPEEKVGLFVELARQSGKVVVNADRKSVV